MQERVGLPSMASMAIPCLELSSSSNVERLSPSFGLLTATTVEYGSGLRLTRALLSTLPSAYSPSFLPRLLWLRPQPGQPSIHHHSWTTGEGESDATHPYSLVFQSDVEQYDVL